MAKPTSYPRWSETSGGTPDANITTPTSGQMDTGWTVGQKPVVSGYLNWFEWLTYKWISWFDSREDDLSKDLLRIQASNYKLETGSAGTGNLWAISSSPTGTIYVTTTGAGKIYSSTDLANWTERLDTATVSMNDVAHNGSALFCAVGTSQLIYTSADGITWTSRTSAITATLRGVAYGNSMWVSIGGTNLAQSSPDGITWTSRTITISSCQKVIFANGLFVAVGGDGTNGLISTSPDGITWTLRHTGAAASVTYSDIAWNGTLFCATGSAVSACATSPDGITWTDRTLPTTGLITLGAAPGMFLAGKNNTTGGIYSSFDGITWTLRLIIGTGPTVDSLYFGPDLFIVAGAGTNDLYSSLRIPAT